MSGNLQRGIDQLQAVWDHPDYMRRVSDGQDHEREPLPTELHHAVIRRDRFTCGICSAGKDEALLQVDHLVPVAAGGTDRSDNLWTLCQPCNMVKSNRFTVDIRAVRPRLIVAHCYRDMQPDEPVSPTRMVFCAPCRGLRSMDPSDIEKRELSRWITAHPEYVSRRRKHPDIGAE